MSENGRIVIPAPFRDQLHISSGEELIFQLKDNELLIYSLKHALEKAQKKAKAYRKNQNFLTRLKQLRKEDE